MGFLPATASTQEAVCAFSLLDNGDFRERTGPPVGKARLAWWLLEGEAPEQVQVEGRMWLSTTNESQARQPVAGFAATLDGLVIRGRLRGRGRLQVQDGGGGVAEFSLGALGSEGSEQSFELSGEQVCAQLDRPLVPRLEVRITGQDGEPAQWTDLELLVPLPCPSPEELRREIVADLEWIFGTWLTLGVDSAGDFPAFVTRYFDAVRGDTINPIAGGLFPLFGFLLDALEVQPNEEWSAALANFLEAYLDIGLHPVTGMPRKWNAEKSSPQDGQPLEIATDLEFLIDVAERGPEKFRARAREAAMHMGETVLEHGVLPDGTVASLYRPSDAAAYTDVAPVRRLDLPAQLARLAALTGDERWLDAARNALAQFEYTNLWYAHWNEIDPGFDDDYGNYAGRARVMLSSFPEEPLFRAVIESGFEYFAPLWREALRGGGSVAADQVRCWDLLVEHARHSDAFADSLRPLIRAAVRAQFKGQQYSNGAWGDVTFFAFDPKTGIEVGDLPGTPSNLLHGLAIASQAHLELPPEELRAMFTAVLRSTRNHYRREHGYLLTQREHTGPNGAGGGLRMAEALILMLRVL